MITDPSRARHLWAGLSFRNDLAADEVFTPSAEQLSEAREILAAMEQAKKDGSGAAVYKGRLVDIASIRQAEVIVRQAELIGAD